MHRFPSVGSQPYLFSRTYFCVRAQHWAAHSLERFLCTDRQVHPNGTFCFTEMHLKCVYVHMYFDCVFFQTAPRSPDESLIVHQETEPCITENNSEEEASDEEADGMEDEWDTDLEIEGMAWNLKLRLDTYNCQWWE